MNTTHTPTRPLIVLHRIPTAGELRFLLHYAKVYKEMHPGAKRQELCVAVQKKFESKKIFNTNPHHHAKSKNGFRALTRQHA